MSGANRANIGIGPIFIRIILAPAKHLGRGLKFNVNFQANGRLVIIFIHRF
jgi:hypothetical protein